MTSWIFIGRVVPERFPVRVQFPASSNVVAQLGLRFDSHVGIADGQIIVDVSITQGSTDLPTLRNLVEQDIRTMTDLIGYQNGFAYDVDLILAICRDTGERHVFGPVIPILSQRRGGVFSSSIDLATLSAVVQEIGAKIALASFREAIKVAVDSGFFCYRAIEAMMQSMRVRDSEKDKVVWDRLKTTLCVEESAIYYVKGHADTPRHGKASVISDAERATVFSLTDEIIKRYIQYLVRGKTPLPLAEFPKLSG
jgi:hypothetical protein